MSNVDSLLANYAPPEKVKKYKFGIEEELIKEVVVDDSLVGDLIEQEIVDDPTDGNDTISHVEFAEGVQQLANECERLYIAIEMMNRYELSQEMTSTWSNATGETHTENAPAESNGQETKTETDSQQPAQQGNEKKVGVIKKILGAIVSFFKRVGGWIMSGIKWLWSLFQNKKLKQEAADSLSGEKPESNRKLLAMQKFIKENPDYTIKGCSVGADEFFVKNKKTGQIKRVEISSAQVYRGGVPGMNNEQKANYNNSMKQRSGEGTENAKLKMSIEDGNGVERFNIDEFTITTKEVTEEYAKEQIAKSANLMKALKGGNEQGGVVLKIKLLADIRYDRLGEYLKGLEDVLVEIHCLRSVDQMRKDPNMAIKPTINTEKEWKPDREGFDRQERAANMSGEFDPMQKVIKIDTNKWHKEQMSTDEFQKTVLGSVSMQTVVENVRDGKTNSVKSFNVLNKMAKEVIGEAQYIEHQVDGLVRLLIGGYEDRIKSLSKLGGLIQKYIAIFLKSFPYIEKMCVAYARAKKKIAEKEYLDRMYSGYSESGGSPAFA